jgi:mannose-6-phosphate isomerase-like protein (cupin superfamily)
VVSRYVTVETAAEPRRDGDDTATTRITIDGDFGSEHLEQRLLRFAPGRSQPRGGGRREEILFVVSGSGSLVLDGRTHPLEPETGAYIEPGKRYAIENPNTDELVVVSVLALDPGADEVGREGGPLTVRLADQPPFPAGKDREFRYVIGPDTGCRTVTQFVGSIPPGRAKPHYHTYDEVAYVLAGEGLLHIGGEKMRVASGSCIHFPRLKPHILENVGAKTLRVMGVFHPAGDPSAAYNVPETEWEEDGE